MIDLDDRSRSTGARPGSPTISIVIPALDEARRIEAAVSRAAAQADEVLVVDGGSRDTTRSAAARAGAVVLEAPRGRASQMNAGARAATGEVLVFVHADVVAPPDLRAQVATAIAAGSLWGRFDVALVPGSPLLRLVASAMNWRSRATGIATGDQILFVVRERFEAVGGFAPISLMEDIDISRRLKRRAGRPACLPGPVRVDDRRWRRDGVIRTILTMWLLRLLYWGGVDPQRLHAIYYRARPPGDGTGTTGTGPA